MSRSKCLQCDFIISRCLCDSLVKIENHIPIVILQAPAESKHVINSVNILKNCLTNIKIIEGYEFQVESILESYKSKKPFMVYPSFENEIEIIFQTDSPPFMCDLLIFIDGTWDKSKRIYLSNPKLQTIPKIHLKNFPTLYELRKTNFENSMSTLESVAYTLSACHDKEAIELLKPFKVMLERQAKFLPKGKTT